MRRTTLSFRLSGPDIQRDLLHEFSLHQDVSVSAADSDGAPVIVIDTLDSPAALWDVRATVGMFDDQAEELSNR